MPNQVINVADAIAKEGFELRSADNHTGKVVLFDKTNGQEVPTTISQVGEGLGYSPEQLANANLVFNTPDTALEESPLNLAERVRVKGFGNTKGAMEWLKKEYDDVMLDPDKGIVVNNRGVWQRIDPDYLGNGDAWSKTRELMGDIADVADLGVNTVAAGQGAAIGGALAGPLGAIGGAAVGGLASGAVRTLTGRILGTFNATPEEQLQDIGMEALLTMGGQAAGMGIGYLAPKIVSGIKGFVENAAPASKEIMKGLLSRVSAQGRDEAVETLFQNPDDVVKGIGAFLGKHQGSVAAAMDDTATQKVGLLSNFLEKSAGALNKKFAENYDEMLYVAEQTGAKFNVGEMLDDVVRGVNELGVGKVAEKGIGRSAVDTALQDAYGLSVTAAKEGGEDIGKRVLKFIGNDMAGADRTPEAAKPFINDMMAELNYLGKKAGTLTGQQGAAKFRQVEAALNKIGRDAMGKLGVTDKNAVRVVMEVKDSIKASVANQYSKAGLAKPYERMIGNYTKYVNDVEAARAIMGRETGAETLLKQILAGPGKNVMRNSMVKNLSELYGPGAEQILKKIDYLHAVETFMPLAPRMSLGQGIAAGTAAAGGALVSPAIGGTVGAATGALAFPRAAAKIVQGATNMSKDVARTMAPVNAAAKAVLEPAYQLKGWLQSLPPDKMKAFISDPKLFEAVMRTVVEAPRAAERMKQTIVQGAVGNGQPQQ